MSDRRIWFTPRAVRLHAVILVVVPGFMALCAWQVSRALDGNSLSWAYVFEWPLFAGYAVYMWWRLVHEAANASPPVAAVTKTTTTAVPNGSGPRDNAAGVARDARGSRHGSPTDGRRSAHEDPELAAYNAYLAELAKRDSATGR